MEKLLKIKLTKEELDMSEAAAIKAGYSPKSARRTASRLLRTPRIRRCIERGLVELKRQEKIMERDKRINAMADLWLGGVSKTKAMIAGGYSPRSAQSNANRIFPRGSYRYKRFVHGLFLFGWDKAKAARYAGYNPKWAGTNTTRLMKHPAVQAELLNARRALHPENYPAQESVLGND